MDISTLKAQVRSGLVGNQFSLETTGLSSALVTQISDDCFPNNTIKLSDATIEEPTDGQSIIVRGTGVDLPFKGMPSEFSFYLAGDDAALRLKAKGDDAWTLVKGFPPFIQTFAASLRFSASPQPPTLYLNSHDGQDGKSRGLFFEGTIDLNAMTGGLASLAGRQYQTLSGPITLKKKGSELHAIDLVAPVSNQVEMVIATVNELRFKVASRLNFSPLSDNYFIVPYVELGAEIPFSAKGQTHSLPLAVQIYNLDSAIRFTADINGSIDAALDELESLTNSVGFGDLLPRGNFRLAELLQFDEFFFDFNPKSQNKVELIGLGVKSAAPWPILHLAASNQDLVARNIRLSFRLFDPFDAKNKSLIVTGEVSLGNAGALVVSTHYPEPLIRAYIKEGTVLQFTDILETFLGTNAGMPAIEVDILSFAVSAGGYSLSIGLDGDVPLIDNLLSLEEAGFDITHEDATSTRAAIRGSFRIAGIDVSVTADYPGAGGDWKFQGSTGAGQEIHIGTLIDDLAKRFGAVTLPASISDLIVENLAVSFSTKTKDFTFTCEGKFPVEDKKIDIVLNIALEHDGAAYAYLFSGHIQIGTVILNLTFSTDAASSLLFASYTHSGDQQSFHIKSLVENVSSSVASLIPETLEIDLKDVLFAFSKTGNESKFLFGLDIGTSINLSNLPLVGREFPPDKTLSVDDLQLLVASRGLTQQEVKAINKLAPASVTKLPEKTQDDGATPNGSNGTPASVAATAAIIPQGVTVSATMNFGGSTRVLSMPVAAGAESSASSSQKSLMTKGVAGASASDDAKWFNLQKTFGPVYFDKVGVRYKDAALWFLLNAALSGAGLTISLDGLSVGSPLKSFSPRFDLRGLGIDYQGGAVEIGGAFLRIEKDGEPDQYEGTAVIKTEEVTLSALGSYTKLDGHPSLFIYAFVDYPLGGPAFFFVTGLAAGFGYNRKLIAPSIEHVSDFPLIKQAIGGKAEPGGLSAALEALQQYIPPAIGEVFLAVGVKFNSFKLIDSFALLTVEFGGHFVVNLLGLSTAIIPTPEAGKSVTPLAEVQIAWKATFDPADGFLGVDARLTPNSYILSRDCRLTGGYAFYSWFSGEHAGDFVQTLGGYHPSFVVPAHYPVVPRLGFNWKVSSVLTIKGDAYYALTGSALMAGGHLEVTFETGDLKAWLKLGADFLISWKPYHYDASVYVDVGVSYTFEIDLLFGSVTVTISVDVGADLHLWGPDFSGTADIHLWIISFSISFGARASQTPRPIDWSTFKDSFLPKAEKVCSIAVKDGLVRKIGEGSSERLIINPKHFSLLVNSAIPFKTAQHNAEELVPAGANTRFGIASMGVEELHSTISIALKRDDKAFDEFSYAPIRKRVPAGLWGQSLTPNLNGNTFIEDVPTGLEIKPGKQPDPGETALIDLSKFKYTLSYFPKDEGYPVVTGYAYAWEPKGSFTPSPDVEGRNAVRDSVENNSQRDSLLKALAVNVDVNISANVAKDFLSAPKIGTFSG
ncbi:MAG TPA: DUF6603 domain-containing protein [Pyrinomonadaceae bacterium]|jgi:hypothetical protein